MSKSHVCMTQCPICGKDSGVAIDRKLRNKFEFNDRIPMECDECTKLLKQNNFALIEIKDGESGNQPYRTGKMWWVNKSAALKINLKSNVSYIEESIAKEIGLYEFNPKENNNG